MIVESRQEGGMGERSVEACLLAQGWLGARVEQLVDTGVPAGRRRAQDILTRLPRLATWVQGGGTPGDADADWSGARSRQVALEIGNDDREQRARGRQVVVRRTEFLALHLLADGSADVGGTLRHGLRIAANS